MTPEDDAVTPPARKIDRRKESRQSVEGTAILHLLDPGIRLRGRILDLSLNGCQFRTEDCFPLGIRSRVEIEFQLDGLPFRLAGVTQSIHKRHKVGVQFLSVSERKRAQLVELIAEIKEIKARATAPNPNVPGR
jgi:c-di-GMP-binding flagellar brake protein YcgR